MCQSIGLNETVVQFDELTDRGLTLGQAIERVVDDWRKSRYNLHHRAHIHTTSHLSGCAGVGYGLSERAYNLLLLTLTIFTDAVHVRADTATDIGACSTIF